ncbi:O-antigen ligase family protein [Microlunatus flavus]|uniref:O-antigen ligase n=1 Tax=Microlunatus flavus TaxID=1036181 RepID=A0A1H9H882_9ACTN|nr:O-antigen ligase family protein [Microlunatus flavus]SEQ58535.1 O-antigen ligase [Microlunatus flavus]
MSNVRPAATSPGAVLVPAALVVVAVLALGAIAAASPTTTLVVVGLAVLVVAASLPTWVLPSVSLWLFALIPVGYLIGVPNVVGRFYSPAVVVLMIFLVRVVARRGRQAFVHSLRWLVPVYAVLLVLSYTGLSPSRSVNWLLVVAICIALPAALVPSLDDKTSGTLLRSWFVLGIGLAILAVIESLLQTNPLSDYYSFDQHWALYRVSTTLGHPLMAGTFFAVTAALAAFSMTRQGAPRQLAFGCFVLCALAAGLTGSRSGVYALVSGLGVGLAVTLVSGRTSLANKFLGVLLGTVALVVLPALPTIAGRANSAEGTASSLYRDYVVRLAGRLFLERPVVGYGPGNSATAAIQSGAKLPLENSVLGTLVSGGVIGTAALLVLVVVVLVRVGRSGRADGVAAIAAYVVAGAAFPLWESNPAGLALVGLVVIATRTADAAPGTDPVAEADAAKAVGGRRTTPQRPVLVRSRPQPVGVRR